MGDERLQKILGALLERTNAGQVAWERTAREGAFLLTQPGYSVLVSEEGPGKWSGTFSREVVFRDEEGQTLESLHDKTEVAEVNRLVRELYITARRQALKVDEKLNRILESVTSTDAGGGSARLTQGRR